MPIKPVNNNTQAPSHKIAQFLNNKLQNLKILPNTYNIKNSIKIAEELTQININQNNKLISLDIKDLYTNLPKQGLTMAARQWLQQSAVNHEESKQIILLINTIMEQNSIQYNNLFFKPQKGIIMGSPLSGTLAELYLQKIEKDHIKLWLDS